MEEEHEADILNFIKIMKMVYRIQVAANLRLGGVLQPKRIPINPKKVVGRMIKNFRNNRRIIAQMCFDKWVGRMEM